MKILKTCINCIMDTSDSNIIFDEHGICDHCNTFKNKIEPFWQTNENGKLQLEQIESKIKKTSVTGMLGRILGWDIIDQISTSVENAARRLPKEPQHLEPTVR